MENVDGASPAAQGGRDRLAWVRQLVAYTETHPIHVPEQHAGAQKTVFPALRLDRREDVVLLQQWLVDTMQLLSAQFPAGTAASVSQVPNPA